MQPRNRISRLRLRIAALPRRAQAVAPQLDEIARSRREGRPILFLLDAERETSPEGREPRFTKSLNVFDAWLPAAAVTVASRPLLSISDRRAHYRKGRCADED